MGSSIGVIGRLYLRVWIPDGIFGNSPGGRLDWVPASRGPARMIHWYQYSTEGRCLAKCAGPALGTGCVVPTGLVWRVAFFFCGFSTSNNACSLLVMDGTSPERVRDPREHRQGRAACRDLHKRSRDGAGEATQRVAPS